ncbi:hypothetical protein chiPu_0029301, partial [Chiloscyllium punctatum]|nr:hypothetical protein [Chiloscyllium punctatum]
PVNGSILLYNRKKVKYRKDGYCWKKRKDGKTTREDHMKLKVQGMEESGDLWVGQHSLSSLIVPQLTGQCQGSSYTHNIHKHYIFINTQPH